jgi:hypothetical protein
VHAPNSLPIITASAFTMDSEWKPHSYALTTASVCLVSLVITAVAELIWPGCSPRLLIHPVSDLINVSLILARHFYPGSASLGIPGMEISHTPQKRTSNNPIVPLRLAKRPRRRSEISGWCQKLWCLGEGKWLCLSDLVRYEAGDVRTRIA